MLMKKICFLFIICMNAIICRVNAQQMPQIAVIQAFEQQRYACLIKKDTFCLKKLIADDLVYTHSNATVDDKTTYFEALKTHKYTFDAFQTDSTSYRFLNKKTVIAAGIVNMAGMYFKTPFKIHGRFTAVYVYKQKHWQLAMWQTTKFPN